MGLEARRLTIHFGIKDKEIAHWIKGVNRGVFSFIIKSMIRSYINNEPYCKASSLLNNYIENPGSFNKNLSMGLEDEDIYQFILSQEEKCRADKVKEIVKFYMREEIERKSPNSKATTVTKPIQDIIRDKEEEVVITDIKEDKVEEKKVIDSNKKIKTIDDIVKQDVSEEEQEALADMFKL